LKDHDIRPGGGDEPGHSRQVVHGHGLEDRVVDRDPESGEL
jgi:hypothetical protein